MIIPLFDKKWGCDPSTWARGQSLIRTHAPVFWSSAFEVRSAKVTKTCSAFWTTALACGTSLACLNMADREKAGWEEPARGHGVSRPRRVTSRSFARSPTLGHSGRGDVTPAVNGLRQTSPSPEARPHQQGGATAALSPLASAWA